MDPVKKSADLAMLKLSPEEETAAARSFAALEVLSAHLPGEAQPPLPEAPSARALRPDEPLPSLPRDALLSGAPAARDGYILAPRAFGKGEE